MHTNTMFSVLWTTELVYQNVENENEKPHRMTNVTFTYIFMLLNITEVRQWSLARANWTTASCCKSFISLFLPVLFLISSKFGTPWKITKKYFLDEFAKWNSFFWCSYSYASSLLNIISFRELAYIISFDN